MPKRVTMVQIRKQIKRDNERNDAFKRRLARAIPYMAERLDQFTIWGTPDTWEAKVSFKTGAQAARFCDHAEELGHQARMDVRPRWSRNYGGSYDGRYSTSRIVYITLNPKKAEPPPPPPPPFREKDARAVKLDLKHGTLTFEGVKGAIKKFPVGKKVARFLDGKKVEDAVGGGSWDMLEVSPDQVRVRSPFSVVTMTWEPMYKAWVLDDGHGRSETTKSVSVALWKVLATAWTQGIRGVIM